MLSETDLSLPGSQLNRFALTTLISRATNMLFRAPTSHRRKTNSICSIWQVAVARVICLTWMAFLLSCEHHLLASGIEVALPFSKWPFRSTCREVKSIVCKHSFLSKWSRQGHHAANSRLRAVCQQWFLIPNTDELFRISKILERMTLTKGSTMWCGVLWTWQYC